MSLLESIQKYSNTDEFSRETLGSSAYAFQCAGNDTFHLIFSCCDKVLNVSIRNIHDGVELINPRLLTLFVDTIQQYLENVSHPYNRLTFTNDDCSIPTEHLRSLCLLCLPKLSGSWKAKNNGNNVVRNVFVFDRE